MTYGVAHDDALATSDRYRVEPAFVEIAASDDGVHPVDAALALETTFSPPAPTSSK